MGRKGQKVPAQEEQAPPVPGPGALLAASPELGVLLVEIPALPCAPVSNLQHLDDNVVALPAALPKLWGAGRSEGRRQRPASHPPSLNHSGGKGLRTSPDWFSFSLWPRLNCRKSIPASLFRVPLPGGKRSRRLASEPQEHPPLPPCPVEDVVLLTGPSPGGALPEGVLIGNASQALSQLFCALWKERSRDEHSAASGLSRCF